MKNRLSFALIYICLLASLTLGGYLVLLAPKEGALSESENRMLRSFPALTGASLADGSFMDAFEGFLSDAVPGRDGLIRFSREEEKRKLYKITPVGKEILNLEIERIKRLYRNIGGN